MLFCFPWNHQSNILNHAFLGSLYFLLIFFLIAYHGGTTIGIKCALPPTRSHISFPHSPHHQGSWQEGRRQNRTQSAFCTVRGKKKSRGRKQWPRDSPEHHWVQGIYSRGPGHLPPPRVSKRALDVERHGPPVVTPPWIPTSSFRIDSILPFWGFPTT